MSILGYDRSTIIAGAWAICAECWEATPVTSDISLHLPSCSLSAAGDEQEAQPATPPRRTTDPNVYVWTDKGFERAVDVERPRRRR